MVHLFVCDHTYLDIIQECQPSLYEEKIRELEEDSAQFIRC